LVVLRKIINRKKQMDASGMNLTMRYMHASGYLVRNLSGRHIIPNEEVRRVLIEKMSSYYSAQFSVDVDVLDLLTVELLDTICNEEDNSKIDLNQNKDWSSFENNFSKVLKSIKPIGDDLKDIDAFMQDGTPGIRGNEKIGHSLTDFIILRMPRQNLFGTDFFIRRNTTKWKWLEKKLQKTTACRPDIAWFENGVGLVVELKYLETVESALLQIGQDGY
jgi:hypothetical protein